jgi:hypothetical protein
MRGFPRFHTCTSSGEETLKYGARNKIKAKVASIQKGDVVSLVKATPPPCLFRPTPP